MLREESEERIGRVVEDGSSEKPTRGGDECRRGAVSAFRRNKFMGKNARWRSDINRGISVDVNVVLI